MSRTREDHLEVDHCPECLGLWLDGEELRHLLPLRALTEQILARERQETPTRAPLRPGGERTCPRCRLPMEETRLGEVRLDLCRRCRGLWLDHGELTLALGEYRAGSRGNLVILNQLAEGLKAAQEAQEEIPGE